MRTRQKAHAEKHRQKKSGVVSVITFLLILICSATLLYSLYQVVSIGSEYAAGKNEYAELSVLVRQPEETVVITIPAVRTPAGTGNETAQPAETGTADTQPSDETAASDPDPAPQKVALTIPTVDFGALKAINPEVGGWISISGTVINYPVTFPDNNEYYVTHTYKGQENSSGCIFMDCRNDDADADRNVILYGHNMKNRTMFGLVKQYAAQAWYDSHPAPVFVTEKQTYLMLVFSAYYTKVGTDAWRTDFSNDEAFAAWLNTVSRRSLIRCDIQPSVSDRVLTLSTCSDATGDGRFVVHGILVPLDELMPIGG